MADNPYEKIGSAVEQWCKDHVYAQMLVTISIGYAWELPHEETHLLDFDAEKGELVWDSDWWEGQQHVELVGFTPLYKVRLKGEGEYARTIRHGRWVKARGSWCTPGGDPVWECSECGKGVHVYGIEHGTYGKDIADGQWAACPNCMANMREVDNE